VARAIAEARLQVDSLGKIPTPALASFAIEHGQPSIMVTGSHIPLTEMASNLIKVKARF
jgi:phosphomannomutase